MAGVKTAKKGKGKSPAPSLTRRVCTKCSARIMSNDMSPLLVIDMDAKTRVMTFSHKKACPQ